VEDEINIFFMVIFLQTMIPSSAIGLSIVGDANVGKSSLFYRMIHGEFPEKDLESTVYETYDRYMQNETKQKDGSDVLKGICVRIRDTKGGFLQNMDEFQHDAVEQQILEEVFSSSTFVLMYDLSNAKSIKNLKNSLETIFQQKKFKKPSLSDDRSVILKNPCLIIGNKLDLVKNEKRKNFVTETFCNEYHIDHLEISAKEGTNVELLEQKIFELCSRQCTWVKREKFSLQRILSWPKRRFSKPIKPVSQ